MNKVNVATDLRLHIHGDNVVECERALELIVRSLNGNPEAINGPIGISTSPDFRFEFGTNSRTCRASFFPGFGRWNENILNVIREVPNALREAADVVVCIVADDVEVPRLAIEFCGALPAGNQAWQRNGRAYSCGVASIPYLYVAELGGYELTKERERKAPRLPNPVVPFSYLTYSRRMATAVMPVFVSSLGADHESRQRFEAVYGEAEMEAIVAASLLGLPSQEAVDALYAKTVQLLQVLSRGRRAGITFTPEQWDDCWNFVKTGESVTNFIVERAWTPWAKRTSIPSLTNTARAVMQQTAEFATGFTSNSVPLCIVPADKRSKFRDLLETTYGSLSAEFERWISRDRNLTICWILGFKPKGDDARPDRGLPPLAKMLCDEDDDILSFVYGPAVNRTWPMLRNDREALAKQNGLWEAIITASDAIVVDSATNNVPGESFVIPPFVNEHHERVIVPLVNAIPSNYGENDVDTALHLLLKYCSGNSVFEGMCNPPGGDWSGISVLTADRATEFRWLSLPRVSQNRAKRPDHVFQLFRDGDPPIVWSVESKETPGSVEKSIGPRLNAYLHDLLSYDACVSRQVGSKVFSHASSNLDHSKFKFASGAAFILDEQSDMDMVSQKAEVDVVLGFQFDTRDGSCQIHLKSHSAAGTAISETIRDCDCSNIAVEIQLLNS